MHPVTFQHRPYCLWSRPPFLSESAGEWHFSRRRLLSMADCGSTCPAVTVPKILMIAALRCDGVTSPFSPRGARRPAVRALRGYRGEGRTPCGATGGSARDRNIAQRSQIPNEVAFAPGFYRAIFGPYVSLRTTFAQCLLIRAREGLILCRHG